MSTPQWVSSNDFGFLLQEHDADPEREPPGECCRTPAVYPVGSKPLLGRCQRRLRVSVSAAPQGDHSEVVPQDR